MTKNLLLVRHAKSSWDDASIADVDRPLNSRGKKNAPEMAGRLKKMGIYPDLMITSHATRANDTARIFAEVLGLTADRLHVKSELYLAGIDDFLHVLGSISDAWNTIAVFSHNPGITEFANSLTNARIDNMPTASIFAVKFDVGHWNEIKNGKGEFWFFDYPKSKDK